MHVLSQGRIILTGGAGLIGSAIVWALNRHGIEDILIVDRLDTTEKWRNVVPLRYADYLDADDFITQLAHSGTLDNVRVIFHLGACSSTTERDAAFLIRNNFEYTKTLAKAAIEHGVDFIYASSAATYGSLEDGLDDRSDLEFLRTLRPLNMYAYSKQLFDIYAQQHGWLDRICGVKYFNIFGPNEQHKGDMRSIVQKAYEQIRDNGGAKLFKSYRPDYRDGEQQRDFLYVKDAAEMTIHLAAVKAHGIFNIGSGKAHTWLELVKPIFAALNVSEKIEFIEMPEQLRGKYQYSTRAQTERLRKSGYSQSITPLQEAVIDYVTNYLIPDRHLDPATT